MNYKLYNLSNFKDIKQIKSLGEECIHEIEVVGHVFPFKTNNYVVEKLIDWNNFKTDPCFLINFPQREMLHDKDFERLSKALKKNTDKDSLNKIINEIRYNANPDSSGQTINIPSYEGHIIEGAQHKYRETLLFFPSQGQTCHAFCTFCFRWPQFSGLKEIKFSTKDIDSIIKYFKENAQLTDILITGGDPMTMRTDIFESYIDRILDANIPNLQTIRVGSKTLSYWPNRYLTDDDSKHLLSIFRKITDRGINLSFMAHFNHINEMKTTECKKAVDKILSTGAQIRSQSPMLRHINDDANMWAEMWRLQMNWNIIPYYVFIARDTGASRYFALSIEKVWEIYREAYAKVSGLCRTVRGPSMSTVYGKIVVNGITSINNKKAFSLSFIQAKNSKFVGIPFHAQYDSEALWIDDLKPLDGDKFFFQD